jgi:hypothetical protein
MFLFLNRYIIMCLLSSHIYGFFSAQLGSTRAQTRRWSMYAMVNTPICPANAFKQLVVTLHRTGFFALAKFKHHEFVDTTK